MMIQEVEKVEPCTPREQFIVEKMARSGSPARVQDQWRRYHPAEKELTEDEIERVIAERHVYYLNECTRARRLAPQMPDIRQELTNIDYWLGVCAQDPERHDQIPRLLQIKGNLICKHAEVMVKIKRPFVETALEIHKRLIETPGITPDGVRKELASALERLKIPLTVEDVLAGGAA